MYSITVLIVTYKQEDLIGRAIESVLAQKDWGLKSIIVQDDCSPDNNWGVIQEYQNKYPDYVVAYRNEKNLGIYGNYDSLIVKRGEADLFYILEGDDAICNGWFKAVQESLKERKIDLKDQAVAICSDYKIVRPNGISIVAKNNRLVENKDVSHISLKARNIISFRSTLATSKVYDRFTRVDLSKGIGVAEEMADMRIFLYSDKFYYVPFIASIYYTHMGISTRLSSEEYFNERIAGCEWLKTLNLDKKAMAYQDYRIAQRLYMLNTNCTNFGKMFKAYIKAFDKYTFKSEQKCLQTISWIRMFVMLVKHSISFIKQKILS